MIALALVVSRWPIVCTVGNAHVIASTQRVRSPVDQAGDPLTLSGLGFLGVLGFIF